MQAVLSRDVLQRRIEAEYGEMPGLTLTLWQAGRLWNVPQDECEAALESLVRKGFLRLTRDGRFLRSAQ